MMYKANVIFILALIGILLSIISLAVLNREYVWMAALACFLTGFYVYLAGKIVSEKGRDILIVSGGMLLFSLPFSAWADYMDFFRFTGASTTLVGILLLLFRNRIKSFYQDLVIDEDTYQEIRSRPKLLQRKMINLPAAPPIGKVLFYIVVAVFLINQLIVIRTGFFSSAKETNKTVPEVKTSPKPIGSSKLTVFDRSLPETTRNIFGNIDSQHIHADFRIYIDGQPMDFSRKEYLEKSAYIHTEDGQNKEKVGKVLHMHAKNVPLWVFFFSIGMKLDNNNLVLPDGKVLKNENGKTLKLYVNGQKLDMQPFMYIFKQGDRILLSYGPENDPATAKQLDAVTAFAKDYK